MACPELVRIITEWLMQRAYQEKPMAETIELFAHKLINGGIPVCRISISVLIIHPNMGGLGYSWDTRTDSCSIQHVPRSMVLSTADTDNPFYILLKENLNFVRYRLNEPGFSTESPILRSVIEAGATDYVCFNNSYGRTLNRIMWAEVPPEAEGVCLSFATRRISGFSDEEIENLKTLSLPLSLAIKLSTEKILSTALLETYLGKISGQNVLMGTVEKGDGEVIDCALWYSDLRRSTNLAAGLEIGTYMEAINEYFDCTAGAVLEHGGEVLKFVGDGVMAIFPIDGSERLESDMCAAAIAASTEALQRLDLTNSSRAEKGQQPLQFGIGLHRGKVLYGNVGTTNRLDMTVTGPAANEVSRLESLCKRTGVPMLASRSFAKALGGDLHYLGEHEVAGISEKMQVYSLSELIEAAPKAVSANAN
jgi:adenylate cyclase